MGERKLRRGGAQLSRLPRAADIAALADPAPECMHGRPIIISEASPRLWKFGVWNRGGSARPGWLRCRPRSVLEVASWGGHLEVVERLPTAGANVNANLAGFAGGLNRVASIRRPAHEPLAYTNPGSHPADIHAC